MRTDPYVGDYEISQSYEPEMSVVLSSHKTPKMKPGWDPECRPLILFNFFSSLPLFLLERSVDKDRWGLSALCWCIFIFGSCIVLGFICTRF